MDDLGGLSATVRTKDGKSRSDFRGVRVAHERCTNLKKNAANIKTIPMFTVSRSQNSCLKNRTSTATIMAAITTM